MPREPQMHPEKGKMFSFLLKPPGAGAQPLEIPHWEGNSASSTFGEDPGWEGSSHPQLGVLCFFFFISEPTQQLSFWLGQLLSAFSQLS